MGYVLCLLMVLALFLACYGSDQHELRLQLNYQLGALATMIFAFFLVLDDVAVFHYKDLKSKLDKLLDKK